MKDMIKRTTALLLLVALVVTVLPLRADAAVSPDTALTKLTDEYKPGTGSFTLSEQSRIFLVSDAATGAPADWKQTAELISSEFNTQFKSTDFPLPLVYGKADRVRTGDIILIVDSTLTLAAEGYTLSITTDNCTVTAKDVDGLLYGAFMLLRHFSVYGGTTIPACTVKDEPDTKERTLMLDCARKYWSVEWIENLIRQMAWMGYNTLELHMTEDQGIRMNIWKDARGKTVTDCNGNDFSWICGYKAATWASSYPDRNASSQYTRDDIIRMVNLAKQYHIDIIPSVDFPGHSDYLINKYNAYRDAGNTVTFKYNNKTYSDSGSKRQQIYITNSGFSHTNDGNWGTIDFNKEYSRNLSLAITEAYAEFFKSLGCTKMNIGADEVRGKPGTDFAYSDFVSYINDMCDMLQAKGYTVRAFNDFLEPNYSFDKELEICYWIHNYKNIQSFLDSGHTVYNCAQSYNYYVLRCNETKTVNKVTVTGDGDARSEKNTWWGFHHATEERIYSGCSGTCNHSSCKDYTTGWNPSRVTCNNEDLISCTGSQLGGGYFLIWGDWAGWNGEDQVWNGLGIASDSATDVYDTNMGAGVADISGGLYNLIDRMWSNSVKMWNWDIDSSLSYNSYWPLRNKYRLYPGFTGPSAAPSMKSGSTLTEAPDFPALKSELDRKPALSPSEYSADSYSAWQAAWNSAKLVYDNHLSTSAAVQNATTNLNTAFKGLETPPATITLMTTVGGTEKTIETVEVNSGTVARVISTPAGYRFSYVEGNVTACKLFSGASAIILIGTVTPATPAKVYYKNTPDLSLLKRLLDAAANAPEGSEYAAAAAAAQEFYNSCSTDPAASVTQAEVDAKVTALLVARTQASFADTSVTTEIISVRSTSDYVAKGKSAVLVVTTTADVTELKITDSQSNNVELAECVAQASTMANGDVVKVWYLRFPMNEVGKYSYTLTATDNGNGTATTTVQVECK